MITTDEAAAIANGELTLSSVLLGKALDAVKAKTAALWATMLENPVTTIVAVIGVATAAWVAYQAAHEKSLKSLKESLDETKDRINSVTDKIKDNTTRIEELQKLKTNGTISAAEEAELETLTKQTEQYEAQLRFLQEIEKHKTKEYNNKRLEEAREAYNEYTSYGEYGKDVETWNVTRTTKGLGGMQNAVEDYNTALAELAKTQEKVRNFTPDDTEQSAKEAERLEKQLDRDQAKVDAHFDALERHYLELIALREKFDGLDSDEARSMVSFIDGWTQQIADITHVNTPLINDFKHALNDSDLDKAWADFFNRLAASKTDIDLARLIEPEFSANSGLQEWADKYGYTVDDIISHVQKLREEISKPADDAEKAAAKTSKELISFSNRLKSLRVDIVKTLGQGKELTQEQAEAFYNWISAFDYLDGETKDIQQRAQEFLSMLAQYFSIKPEWEINDNYIKNMLRDAEEQYDSLREKIETGLFGNIDLNNRQELHWDNDEIIDQYKDALLSWGQDLEEIKGSVSTVLGASSEFDGVEIAFSPILQTDSGAKLLSQNTVYDYVNAVLKEAAARNQTGDGWTTELAFEVDKEGLDIAGQHIQGLFADIGDTAMQSGELMHHVSMSIKGDSDALANAFGIAAENKYRAHESALAYIRNFVVNDIADLASLQDELKNTGKAWQEYQNLISGGDNGDTAKQMASAYQKAIEDLENGRFDTKAVWGAAKLLFSDEQLRDMEYDLVEIAKRLRSPMMQALFGKAEDGEDDYEIGVKFANYIRESIDVLGNSAGIIDNGDGTFKFWYDSLGKLSKQLGMSEEALSSLLDALDAYGVESMRSTQDNDALAEKFERIRSMTASADEAVREFARGLLNSGITENHVMDILKNLSDAGVIDLDTSQLSEAISGALEDLQRLENEEGTPKPDIDLSNLNAKKTEITAFKTFLDETLGNLEPYKISAQFDDETKRYLDQLARVHTFSSGTRNAPGGIALVNEKGPELISDGGEAYIANGGRPGFTNLSRGAVVFNAEETEQIFRRGYTNVPIKAFADGSGSTVDKASLRERLLGGKRVGGLATGTKMCPECDYILSANATKCPNCGWGYSSKSNYKTCPNCGAMCSTGSSVCGQCGYNFNTGRMDNDYYVPYEPADNYYYNPTPVDNGYYYHNCANCGSSVSSADTICPYCGKDPWNKVRNTRSGQGMPRSGAGRISGTGSSGGSGNYGSGYGNDYGSGSVGPADYVNQADPQKTDWIAVLINRIQKSVSSLEKIASSGFKSLGTRTDAATMEISELYNQIAVQEQGYDRYMQEAYSVGLPGYIIDQIQNGTIDITEYDEETSAQIDKFSTWYEKALQCKEAVEDLHEKVAQLNLEIFQNTQQDFENQLSAIDHKMNMVDKIVDYNKEFGRVSNMEYYQVATDLEAERIAKLNEELDTLNIKFQDAMNSGEIEECSEAWYSMTSAINSVEEAIVDAHRQMVQYRVDLFNNTQKDYENYLNLIEHRANMVGKRIEMEKLAGNLDSGDYYKALTGVESERIAVLNQELVVLRQRFQEAMNSGEIAECSDAWYNMRFAINSVEEAIADAQYRMVEYRNTVFDYTQRTYENQLSLIDHQMNMASKRLEMAKLSGQVDNSSYYNSLASIESQRIGKLQQQMSAMGNMLIQAMNSGEIRKYSESWYRMITSINSVEEAIADAQIRMIGYGNSAQEAAAAVEEIGEKMHDIEWDYFDFAMEQYGRLQKEANFLIGVMSNDKLFEDNGAFSAKGEATLGLRVLNYNAFMTQAEAYKKEIEDKFSGTLTDKEEIDRRNTLIDLQQQSIQAAENEKNAIRDLVADGIQVEIKSMQELIDAYEKSLDSAKDLYSYQKKISEKTYDVAKLQKQLTAYTSGGDTSEENKARVQKLNEQIKKARENLDETEWEHNISEQKKLLSELQDEYSDFMNDKLNDIEGLVKEATDKVNQNLDDISRSVKMAADQVGYTMSGAMNQLITNGSYAYYDRMFDGVTSVIDYLSAIYQAVQGVTGIREERSTSSGSSGLSSYSYSFGDIMSDLGNKYMDYEPQGVNYNGSYYTKDGEIVIDGDYDPDMGVTLYDKSGYTPLYTGTRTVEDYDEVLLNEDGSMVSLGRRSEQYRYFNVMGKRVIMEQPTPDTVRLYFEDKPRNAQTISTSILENDPDRVRSLLKKMYQQNNPGFYVSDSDFKNILLPFATGGLADYTGLAMLHGSKQRPELVLNADDTEKFLEAAKLMRTPVLSALAGREFTAPLTGLSGGSGGITIENFSVDFDINNPESYEDILAEARNDHRFERLIDSIVFSKIKGGSAFGEKNRIHF